MKRTKRIRHSSGEKVSSNLTLERSGLHSINAISSFLRGFVIAPDTYNGAVTEGLVATKGTGSWDVDISFPASCIQVRGDDLIYATDPGDGTGSTTLTLTAADPVNSRYDIIEARVNTRESFNDDVVYRVDPTTKAVATKTVTRDTEYYIELRATAGTPSATPTPPATSATGTVAEVITPVLGATVNLTSRYLLNLAVGDYDSEYITVDLRAGAADYSIVSLTHVVSNINTAWGSTICNVTGSNEIRFASSGTGGDKVVRFKELGSIRALDAIEVLFTGTTLGPTNRESIILGASVFGYEFEQTGSDGWFKIAEILVVGGSSALVPTDVVPRAQQASWVADAGTIQNLQRFLDLQNGDTVIFTGLMGHTKTLWRDVIVPSLSTVVTFGDFAVDDSVSLIVPDDSDYIHWDDSWKGYVDSQDTILRAHVDDNFQLLSEKNIANGYLGIASDGYAEETGLRHLRLDGSKVMTGHFNLDGNSILSMSSNTESITTKGSSALGNVFGIKNTGNGAQSYFAVLQDNSNSYIVSGSAIFNRIYTDLVTPTYTDNLIFDQANHPDLYFLKLKKGFQLSTGSPGYGGYTWTKTATGIYRILKTTLGSTGGFDNDVAIIVSAESVTHNASAYDDSSYVYVNVAVSSTGAYVDGSFHWIVLR